MLLSTRYVFVGKLTAARRSCVSLTAFLYFTCDMTGLLPVMEIVFVVQKTEVVVDERIAFESVWGMPMSGGQAWDRPGNSGCEESRLYNHVFNVGLSKYPTDSWLTRFLPASS